MARGAPQAGAGEGDGLVSKDSPSKEVALRREIGEREQQLDVDLKRLVLAAEARASLGHYVARYPYQFVIGGLVLGLWLGRPR
jgi:hypothetical protein